MIAVGLRIVGKECVQLRQAAPIIRLNKTPATNVLQTSDPLASLVLTHELEEPCQVSKASNPNNFTSGLEFLLWFSCICDREGDLSLYTPASGYSTLRAFHLPSVQLLPSAHLYTSEQTCGLRKSRMGLL
jgi:hypothetical protein